MPKTARSRPAQERIRSEWIGRHGTGQRPRFHGVLITVRGSQGNGMDAALDVVAGSDYIPKIKTRIGTMRQQGA